MDFPRAHPDCTHCGTILRAMTRYPQIVHDTCPCICHTNKSTKALRDAEEQKKKRKKRK